MELLIQIQVNELDSILTGIKLIENVSDVIVKEKKPISVNVLDRKPNNQFELVEAIITIILTKLSNEGYAFAKDKISEYLKEKKVKIKKINNRNRKNKKS